MLRNYGVLHMKYLIYIPIIAQWCMYVASPQPVVYVTHKYALYGHIPTGGVYIFFIQIKNSTKGQFSTFHYFIGRT